MNNKLENIIIKYLNKLYGDLKVYRTYESPDSVFFVKNKKIYMEHELKYDELNVDYDTIWQDLKCTFSLDYYDIQSIIKKWVEETYNLRGVTPRGQNNIRILWVEETYNLRGVTPSMTLFNQEYRWKRLTI